VPPTRSTWTAIAAVFILVLMTAYGYGRTAQTAFARILPERVAGDVTKANWRTPQFLQADAQGRIFLLHGDDLQVDQILPSGKVVVVRKPQRKEAEDAGVSEAALSPDGRSWIIDRQPPGTLTLLTSDDQRQLPHLHWMPSALAYTDSGPIIAVVPLQIGGESAEAPSSRSAADKPPFLLKLNEQTWQTLVFQDMPAANADGRPAVSMPYVKAERDARLAPGRKGRFWVAQQNAYLLRQYSGLGALEQSVSVGKGQMLWQERTADDWKAMEKVVQANGAPFDRSRLPKMHAVRVIRGLTAQRSGNQVYLAVDTPEGLALDRWDADTQMLDRLLLGVTPEPGRISVAAGRYGLYLAARGLGEPVWHLDWLQLENARWKPVPEPVSVSNPH
jgi:hypothetical protein